MVYILNLKFYRFLVFYRGLNLGPSDPEADGIPMYQRASLMSDQFLRLDSKWLFIISLQTSKFTVENVKR